MNSSEQSGYNPDNLSSVKLWGLAVSALLTEMNELRHDVLHHHGTSDEDIKDLKHMMMRDWGIETREEYLNMLKWLREEGHNRSYMQMQDHLNTLSESAIDAYIDAHSHNVDRQSCLQLVRNYRHTLNIGGIGAWDDGRYVSICRWGASLGLFSEDECWEKIKQISLRVQQSYDSWHSFALSYIAGRQFWRNDATESFAKDEMDVVRRLTGDPKSPWNTLEWNLDLTENCNGTG
ncbi:DUF1266 domain-containing protein [Shewanella woodyi]|uniref:DUF1266 domain-containing protein n=1 Tax=Shewanella woodyi (strain ATCC 51908 / MS32) TaxID=392500 RepID=B1KGR1_SHEWM|nr:DUF1266 domain-containing protein [Shewanella woodyi]ACA86780.1 conserved hypothetical protein [Shewanella woodyi ATCC 51908]